ncbi:MAG: T9SS type A sorting domain-containing protein [Saprospiraceae bacterium]|nr:T9SS type A sorting domain-containing protein [Saprospiraceae bacterium]
MNTYIYILVFTLLQTAILNAQSFNYKGKNLFSMQEYYKDSLQRSTSLLFNDMDSDGDQDLILSGIDSLKFDQSGNITSFSQITYFIAVQENIGTKWSPKFAPRKPFMDSFPFRKGYFFPAAGDLNDDRKLDFVVSSGLDSNKNMATLFYQRKETSGKDQFNIISGDQLGLDPFISGSLFMPSLADMDKDGDLDLFMSGYFLERTTSGEKIQRPVFLYAKNIGTKSNPKFLGWYQNTNGLEKSLGENQFITIGDIDNDQDNDFISLSSSNNISKLLYLENIARLDGKADFKLSKPLAGIPSTKSGERYYPPALVDIDSDGDLDLFMLQDLSKTATGIGYYENNFCTAKTTQWTHSICAGDSVIIGNQVFNQSGQYEIKLNASNQCDSIVKLNLTVRPAITTNLSKSLCAGEEFTIGNEKFTQTGNYTVKLKAMNGCDSIIQASLTFITLLNTVSQTQNTLKADLGGVMYQWFDCDNGSDIPGATGQSFTPVKNGKYGVKLSDVNGCKNSSACVNFVITSNEELNLSNQIILYPNPASNGLSITNDTGFALRELTIINMEGKIVLSMPILETNWIPTTTLNSGNYILEIQCNGRKISKKFEVVRD